MHVRRCFLVEVTRVSVKSAVFRLCAIACLALKGLSAQEVVLVAEGSTIRYLTNVATDPGIGQSWTARTFVDAAWSEGAYGVGYDTTDPLAGMIATEVPPCRSVYTRARFTVNDLSQVQTLHVGADYDDGYAVWLNGVQIARSPELPAGALAWDTNPSGTHESSNGATAVYEAVTDVTATALPALLEGENVLAAGVWNRNGVTSTDIALVAFFSMNRPGPVTGTEVCGTLSGNVTWTAAESPYTATCDVVVPKGSTLAIEAGVEVYFASGAGLNVAGQIYALGEANRRILLTRNVSGTWGGVGIDHGGDGEPRESILRYCDISYASRCVETHNTGTSQILVEDCRLDSWTNVAVYWDASHGLRVRRCDIGVNTPLAEANHESINGYRSGAVVEYCTFGRRRDYNYVIDLADSSWGGPVPTVQYNTFLGGDDDAIDFDGSAGWIVGNLVMDHWPSPSAGGDANGGGITGNDASDPVVINNIVYRCYHGIGYKNGTTPLIMNNLVLDCHIGLTFYKDNCTADEPRPLLYNNIIWNNRDSVTGEPTDVVPHGRWFPAYCQDAGDQAVIDMRHSIVEAGWPGVGNVNSDPMLADPAGGDFSLLPSSPALDSGFGGPVTKPGVSSAAIAFALAMDRERSSRQDLACVPDTGAGSMTFLDRGPLEAPASTCDPPGTARFVRGDANADRSLDISDPVLGLFVLFQGAPADCDDALDSNDDGERNLGDVLYLLNFLFLNGAAIPPPFPRAGADRTADGLTCERAGS